MKVLGRNPGVCRQKAAVRKETKIKTTNDDESNKRRVGQLKQLMVRLSRRATMQDKRRALEGLRPQQTFQKGPEVGGWPRKERPPSWAADCWGPSNNCQHSGTPDGAADAAASLHIQGVWSAPADPRRPSWTLRQLWVTPLNPDRADPKQNCPAGQTGAGRLRVMWYGFRDRAPEGALRRPPLV